MEYQVPQFIEVEDKIFGPLTFKQFVYLAGGAGISIALIVYLHFFGFLIAVPIVLLALALSFYKINNKPFIDILEAGFNYYLGGRLYLWKKDEVQQPVQPVAPVQNTQEVRQKLSLSQNKLHELALALDIQDTGAQNNASNPQ